MKRKKIIHIIGSMNIGGAETFLINVLKNIDKSKYEFVFLCYGERKFHYEEEVKNEGGRIVRIDIPKKVGYIKHIRQLKRVFVDEKPDIIHAHTYLNSAFSVLIANKLKIEKIIIHSHNTKSEVKEGIIYTLYKKIMKYIINRYSNIFLACGDEAGEALFYKKNKFEVIYNGIETKRFLYNEESKKLKRKDLGIGENEFVIGHVGRFMPVKNQEFLVEIFKKYLDINNNAKLIFVGDGPLKSKVQKKVSEYKIEEKVQFLGIRKDVSDLYNAMDLFIFPSFFEGFPVTLIETQMNGLKALVSQKVDQGVKKSEYIQFFDINDDIDSIIKLIEKNKEERNKYKTDLKEFDIKSTVNKLCKYYESEKV